MDSSNRACLIQNSWSRHQAKSFKDSFYFFDLRGGTIIFARRRGISNFYYLISPLWEAIVLLSENHDFSSCYTVWEPYVLPESNLQVLFILLFMLKYVLNFTFVNYFCGMIYTYPFYSRVYWHFFMYFHLKY